jgi:hypothetical protein
VKFDEIANEIMANAAALQREVVAVAEFLDGREHNFRHATFGYLMACMAQIDVMSFCMFGPDDEPGDQTRRMQRFMETYIDPDEVEEHRVAIQLLRHTLMHTGALRYLHDDTRRIAYTWQVYFSDSNASKREHYTLTVEERTYQEHLLEAADGRHVDQIKALNFRLVLLIEAVVRAASAWNDAMRADEEMQKLCVSNYSTVRFQVFNETEETKRRRRAARLERQARPVR